MFMCIGVEMFKKELGQGQAGDNCGVSCLTCVTCLSTRVLHMLQCVATCCSVLQCVLVYGRVLHSQAGGICGAVFLSYVTFLIHVWHLRCKLSFMYHMPHSYLTRLIYSCVTRPIHA